jgi:hypothetical protein
MPGQPSGQSSQPAELGEHGCLGDGHVGGAHREHHVVDLGALWVFEVSRQQPRSYRLDVPW